MIAMGRRKVWRHWAIGLAIFLCLACAGAVQAAHAEERSITLGSTTSTENSGLFGAILPVFTKATGIEVRVIAVGTGQALKLGERGDVDILLVHDTVAEEAFVAGFRYRAARVSCWSARPPIPPPSKAPKARPPRSS
jgi:tungstate transport system substrate-binding protein